MTWQEEGPPLQAPRVLSLLSVEDRAGRSPPFSLQKCKNHDRPLWSFPFHGIEIPHAIRLKRLRGEISKAQESAAIRVFRGDVDAGRLVRPDYDLSAVFIHAERLCAKHSGDIGSRSLDVLHVAAALECGCTELASFDQRQRKIASLSGLKVVPAWRKRS